MIYRGEKMLHFCPTLQSVVSDIEVDWKDITRRQKLHLPSGRDVEVGVIYDIKYPIVGKENDIETLTPDELDRLNKEWEEIR